MIDFFGLSAIASGQPVDFAYPSLTSVVPASVAVVRNGPNPANARAFVEYLLGDEGQQKLFAPDIGRLPVVPALYARAPKGYPNPFAMKLGGVDFDDKLSSGRRNVVNSLFDHSDFPDADCAPRRSAIHGADAQVATAPSGPRRGVEAAALGPPGRAGRGDACPLDAGRASDRGRRRFRDRPRWSRAGDESGQLGQGRLCQGRELAESARRRIIASQTPPGPPSMGLAQRSAGLRLARRGLRLAVGLLEQGGIPRGSRRPRVVGAQDLALQRRAPLVEGLGLREAALVAIEPGEVDDGRGHLRCSGPSTFSPIAWARRKTGSAWAKRPWRR